MLEKEFGINFIDMISCKADVLEMELIGLEKASNDLKAMISLQRSEGEEAGFWKECK